MPADGVSHSAFWLAAEPLVLASGSVTRRLILQSAGLDPEVRPAAIDERSLEANFARKGLDPAQIAVGLAKAKALSVSCAQPGRVVLGADQTLAIGQGQSREYEQLHKATDLAGVRQTLLKLSGRSHVLHSGIALATGRCAALVACRNRAPVRPSVIGCLHRSLHRAGWDGTAVERRRVPI